jgi:hypothetical protein
VVTGVVVAGKATGKALASTGKALGSAGVATGKALGKAAKSVGKGLAKTADAITKGPREAYNRRKHYGDTPSKSDREAIGGESTDHDPPLVKRFYEGDPEIGEKPGYQQTPEERRASAKDRTRMRPSTKEAQRKQGGEMSGYSKQKKKDHDLK